jgi:N6-L-threonylcarbamoyladenine synthase
MSKKPLILGIESSCDETAASIITENEQGNPVVLSNIVSSQVEIHKEFGGVVPELAARSHVEKIDWIVQKAIDDSGRKIGEIDAVASTAGPGLIVCLSVGLSFGKAFAFALEKPFIAVNHLEGHALSPKLNSQLNYPYLLLLISGGHSQFLNVQGLGKYKRLGTTIDDALGEAFDKTAKLLGIEFPGGPKIEILAEKGDPNKYDLPKPIFNKGGCNLSFAGLKTAILRIAKNIKSDQEKFDLAASFQKTVEQILYKKLRLPFLNLKNKTIYKKKYL